MHHGIEAGSADVLATCINALGITRETTVSVASHIMEALHSKGINLDWQGAWSDCNSRNRGAGG